MGLWGLGGLKSAFSIAQLIGQNIVARTITLTGGTAADVNATGTVSAGAISLPSGINTQAASPNVLRGASGGKYLSFADAGGVELFPGAGLAFITRFLQLSDGTITFISYSDGSGTPGNATNNNARGKNAIAIGAATCTITNSYVTAASTVLCVLETADATATTILRCIPGAGSFTLTVNAAATAATTFSWVVLK